MPPFHRLINRVVTTRRLFSRLALLPIVASLAGCAVDNDIRMTPTTSITASQIANSKPVAPGDDIVLYNVSPNGTLTRAADISALNPDLYVTVDVSGLLNEAMNAPLTTEKRNDKVSLLIYLSDRNADVWESRVYARYKLRTGVIGTTRDLATAGAGASSLIVPPVAAGLSAFNLFVGAVSDQVDTTLYSKDTVEALLKAISAARKNFKNKIRAHFDDAYDKYDMFYALDQLRYYDTLVSFRKGIDYASSLADQSAQQADQNASNPKAAAEKEAKAAATPLPPAQP